MAVSVGFNGVHAHANGHITVQFSDGRNIEFLSKQDAIDWASPSDLVNPDNIDLLRKLLCAWWIKQDPTAATPAIVVGKTISMSLGVVPSLTIS